MAKKKNFKKGLNSLLSSSAIVEEMKVEKKAEEKQSEEKSEFTNEEKLLLLKRIELRDTELKFWRTGKLTPEKFSESLKKNKLQYDKKNNIINKK